MMEKLRPRLRFHYKRGLLKLQYTVDHDFVRGFEVMDERTFSHVTSNFYQLTALFRDMVNVYNGTSNNADGPSLKRLREAWYVGTLRDLRKRRHLASRALANITQVHDAFSKGRSIISFKASPGRRYDATYVWMDFLDSRNESNYFRKLRSYTTKFIVNVDMLLQYSDDLYMHGILPYLTTYHKVSSDFEKCSRSYNYYRFLYKHRVVFRAQGNVNKTVSRFTKLNETLRNSVSDVVLAIETLRSQAGVFSATSLDTVRSGVDMAAVYLRNNSALKLDLSHKLTSLAYRDDLQRLVTFFKDLRASGQGMAMMYRRFASNYIALWTNMLEERALGDFYAMVRNDVVEIVQNGTDRSHITTVLAYMSSVSSDVFAIKTRAQLNELLNADFADLNRTYKYDQLRLELAAIIDINNIVTLLGDKVDVFASTMTTFVNSLSIFQDSTIVDGAFYR